MRAIGFALGVLGMLIGCYSAWFAFTHASAAGTEGNSALVIAAFALALAAGLVPLLIRRRLIPAALVMLVCGALGYGASALYSTRTLYFVALFCWLVGAGMLLLAFRQEGRRQLSERV